MSLANRWANKTTDEVHEVLVECEQCMTLNSERWTAARASGDYAAAAKLHEEWREYDNERRRAERVLRRRERTAA